MHHLAERLEHNDCLTSLPTSLPFSPASPPAALEFGSEFSPFVLPHLGDITFCISSDPGEKVMTGHFKK